MESASQNKPPPLSIPWFLRSNFRLFATLFLTLALPTLLLTLIVAIGVRARLHDEANYHNALTAHLVAEAIDEEFYGLMRYVESVGHRERLGSSLMEMDAAAVQIHLQEMVDQNSKLSRAIITDATGSLLYQHPTNASVMGADLSSQDWYRGVRDSRQTYVSEVHVHISTAPARVVAIATPMLDPEGNPVYFLVGHYAAVDLSKRVREIPSLASGQILLLDQNGNHANAEPGADASEAFTNHPVVQAMLANEHGNMAGQHPISGEHNLIGYKRNPLTGWTVAAMQPVQPIHEPVNNLVWQIAMFALVCCIGMCALGYRWFYTLHQYDESRKQVQEELEGANKELEAFSYSVSHDLRAPLRAIDGFSRILLDEHSSQLDPPARECLQMVCDNARQMNRLVDELLKFSRLGRQELQLRYVDPNELVKKSLAELREEQAARRVEIRTGTLLPCLADPTLLKQVWTNLLSNSMKYTRRRDLAVIEIGCLRDELEPELVTYFVKDNGVGFDMQYVHKLFGVFQRLHGSEEYEGTGVGLAIVQRIVHRHGGRIWAEATPDEGATFFFTLREAKA